MMFKKLLLCMRVALALSFYSPSCKLSRPNRYRILTRSSNFDENDVLNFQFESKNEEDAQLYKQFLNQISEMTHGSIESSRQSIPSKKQLSKKSVNSNKMIENPTFLTEGQPVEIIYKQKLVFGNFIEYKDESSHSVLIRLQSDEMVNIDVSQIISVWDILADDTPPLVKEDWASVTTEALEILGKLSPRKSDLAEFWRAVSQRRTDMAIDSMDLGVYIFQEYSFRKWLDPNLEGSDCNVHALSAAQRYAAALLLFFDSYHFKRKPTTHISGVSRKGSCIEGGYKALDDSVVLHRQGEAFMQYFSQYSTNSAPSDNASANPYYNSCVLRMLRALESYAVSPSKVPPAATVKHILKRLEVPITPTGAQTVLAKMKSSNRYKSSGLKNTNNKSVNDVVGASQSFKREQSEVTPWSEGVIEAAESLSQAVLDRRSDLMKSEMPAKIGKKGPLGRLDFRANTLSHPVICLDSRRASFFDDGFSLSPETGEILIHIADVNEMLRRYPILISTAKERVSSVFTPQGPLHMLPPQALDALRLTPNGPNEAITVGISVEFETGRLIGSRVFPSIIGPVNTLDIAMADELLASVENDGVSKTLTLGYSEQVVRDLILTNQLVQRVIERYPWVDAHYSSTAGGSGRETVIDKRSGVYSYAGKARVTPSSTLVNALLTLYSNSSVMFCQKNELPYPVAWENKDRVTSDVVRRFATQPLRNWLSQMQQLQLRAALKMNNALTQSDCALAVSHVNGRRQQLQNFKFQSTQQSSFEAFVNHCEAFRQSTGRDIELLAEVSQAGANGGVIVRLKEFGVSGVLNVKNTFKQGERIRVKVKKINYDGNSILFDLLQSVQ